MTPLEWSCSQLYSRGFGTEESKAALIRARELAAAIDDPTERYTIYYGLWVGNLLRGELRLAREIAETFLREAEREARTTECGVGRRLLGSTCLFQGDSIEAQANLVEALSICDSERDREAGFRFGQDTGAIARARLAITKWQLGEVGPAPALIEEAVAHAIETGHVPSLVYEALALAGGTGEHWSDAFLHRLRGEILLKRDPANTAPAENAFLTAIAVAQQQRARSFELRAALDLARLYSSTGRSADADALLASALKGFSPTPEFPEIAEAQTLLAALA